MTIRRVENEFRDLPSTSILRAFPVFADEDKIKFTNALRTYVIADAVKTNSFLFQWYTVEEDEFIDDISVKFYGTPSLWWLVADVNELVNPFEALEDGMSIKILRADYIYVVFDNLAIIGEL